MKQYNFISEGLLLAILISTLWPTVSSAQVSPDTSSTGQSTNVRNATVNGNPGFLIHGGERRGINLFYSFQDFSVPTGRFVLFDPQNGSVRNLISRVTGGSASNIDGALAARLAPGQVVNLFIINPAGISFGSGASLRFGSFSINGSLIASTAEQIRFSDGSIFSAKPSPGADLLTISTPIGLQFGRNISPLEIRAGATLGINPNQTLALVGGPLNLTEAIILADNAFLDLGAIDSNNEVGLRLVDGAWRLDYTKTQAFQDINLSEGTRISSRGTQAKEIRLRGRHLNLEGATILSSHSPISLTATENLRIANGRLSDQLALYSFGQNDRVAGDITLDAKQITIDSGAIIQSDASNSGTGKSGTIHLKATEQVLVRGFRPNGQSTTVVVQARQGNAQDIMVQANQLFLQEGAQLRALASGSGRGGDIIVQGFQVGSLAQTVSLIGVSGPLSTAGFNASSIQAQATATSAEGAQAGQILINTKALLLQEGGSISATSLGAGAGGNLSINASSSVQILGESSSTRGALPSLISASANSTGSAGSIQIATPSLLIQGGAQVQSATFGAGAGGRILIHAGQVDVEGRSATRISSLNTASLQISTGVATGNAGSLTVNAQQVNVSDGAAIFSSTDGPGNGGELTITSDRINLSGQSPDGNLRSGIYARTEGLGTRPPGSSGTVTLTAQDISVRDGATITIGTDEDANPQQFQTNQTLIRDLNITADRLSLDRGSILAETVSGNGGNININLKQPLILRNQSRISATAGTADRGGDGGNIQLNAPFIVAVPSENSDITANAYTGSGGRIDVITQGLIGIQFRPRLTPQSDITASSEFGQQGIVTINAPDVDPSQGLNQLPADTSAPQPSQGCETASTSSQTAKAEFFTSGRGGRPTSPSDPLSSSTILDDLRIPATLLANQRPPSPEALPPETQMPQAIVEATHWHLDSQGRVVLSAAPIHPKAISHCHLTS